MLTVAHHTPQGSPVRRVCSKLGWVQKQGGFYLLRVHIIRMKIVLFVLCTFKVQSTKYKKYNGSHPEAPKWNSDFCNFILIDVLGFITQNPNVKMDAVLRSPVTVSWNESEHTHADEQERDVIGSREDISPSSSGSWIEIHVACSLFSNFGAILSVEVEQPSKDDNCSRPANSSPLRSHNCSRLESFNSRAQSVLTFWLKRF